MATSYPSRTVCDDHDASGFVIRADAWSVSVTVPTPPTPSKLVPVTELCPGIALTRAARIARLYKESKKRERQRKGSG